VLHRAFTSNAFVLAPQPLRSFSVLSLDC